MDRILVPLDGSPLAEQALPCAMALGRALPAELVIFHAVSVPPDTREMLNSAGLEARAVAERLETEARDYLCEVAGELEESGLTVRRAIRRGPPSETIVDFAAEEGIQQIVMTTHGRTGISRWTHGSVAERVLRSATVPVLLLRAQENELSVPRGAATFRRILVPLDGSNVAEQVLPTATATAHALDAEIVLFQVPVVYVSGSLSGEWYIPVHGVLETAKQDAQAYLNRVASHLEDHQVAVSTGMQIGGVADSIIAYGEANRIDLIAMCTHGRAGLGRWTLGSVADRVLRGSRIPILLVRAT